MIGTEAHLVKSPNNRSKAPPASAKITSQAKNVGKIKLRLSVPVGPKNSANLGFTEGIFSFQLNLLAEVPAPQNMKKRYILTMKSKRKSNFTKFLRKSSILKTKFFKGLLLPQL